MVTGGARPQLRSHRSNLGPGAKKGLSLVRQEDAALRKIIADKTVAQLRSQQRGCSTLAWVGSIDVEWCKPLCEYST